MNRFMGLVACFLFANSISLHCYARDVQPKIWLTSLNGYTMKSGIDRESNLFVVKVVDERENVLLDIPISEFPFAKGDLTDCDEGANCFDGMQIIDLSILWVSKSNGNMLIGVVNFVGQSWQSVVLFELNLRNALLVSRRLECVNPA